MYENESNTVKCSDVLSAKIFFTVADITQKTPLHHFITTSIRMVMAFYE